MLTFGVAVANRPGLAAAALVPALILVLATATVTSASVILLDDDAGVYNRLTVRISDAVPRQLCHKTIKNLQVRQILLSPFCFVL